MLPPAPTLRIAFVPGVTLSKWTTVWKERYPGIPLQIVPIAEADQQHAVSGSDVDVCFVRLPIDRAGLSVIRLYGEQPVAVVAVDHPLSKKDAVTWADLADLPHHRVVTPATLDLVAAGVGAFTVPHSVARQASRKDLVARPISDAGETEIALVWRSDDTTSVIEDFVGVVRGRTAASSRGAAVPPPVTPVAGRSGGQKASGRTPAKRGAGRPAGAQRTTASRKKKR